MRDLNNYKTNLRIAIKSLELATKAAEAALEKAPLNHHRFEDARRHLDIVIDRLSDARWTYGTGPESEGEEVKDDWPHAIAARVAPAQ